MANKRIYRKVCLPENPTEVVGLVDELTKKSIPMDGRNSDYLDFLALLGEGRAAALAVGEALPAGVVAADERRRGRAIPRPVAK